jgi:hypothetical protein
MQKLQSKQAAANAQAVQNAQAAVARYNATNANATHVQLSVAIKSSNADYIALMEHINEKVNELWEQYEQAGIEVDVAHYVMCEQHAIY